MYDPSQPDGRSPKRKLRTHTKSRTGCRNCKIRRVKCDEQKPHCKRCQSYGVSCSYSGRDLLESDRQTWPTSCTRTDVLDFRQCSTVRTILGMVNDSIDHFNQSTSQSLSIFKLGIGDLNCLDRFQGRTVLSLRTSITGAVYQKEIIKLVCQHPYLLHAVMTVTCMHDRYLCDGLQSRRSLIESYHYGQAASLFRRKLSATVPASDHDGLWATCAMLGCIAFFSVEETDPSQVWPLKSSSTDLAWLEVLEGIHVVWAIVKPTRPGSAFEALSTDKSKAYLLDSRNPVLLESTESLPQPFVDLCEVNISSNTNNNPYLAALHTLGFLLDKTCNQNTFLCFLSFTGHMDLEYKQLLHVKDPRALLILAWWYAKLCRAAPWFMASRAMIECQSICVYLKRYHAYYEAVQELLYFPRMECGLSEIDGLPLTPVSMEESTIEVLG